MTRKAPLSETMPLVIEWKDKEHRNYNMILPIFIKQIENYINI